MFKVKIKPEIKENNKQLLNLFNEIENKQFNKKKDIYKYVDNILGSGFHNLYEVLKWLNT